MKKNKTGEAAPKVKKPFYKKWWFWVIVVLALFLGSGDSEPTDTSVDVPATAPSASVADASENTQAATEATAEAATIPNIQFYGEGMYKVGSDLDAGEYYVTSSEYFGAYAEVASDSTGNLDSIIANTNIETFAFFTVEDGQYFTVTDGEFVKVEDAYVPGADLNDTYMAGMYRVGTDIPAGEYKVTCTSDFGAYVEVATDSTHRLDSIVTNDNVDTTSYVTVQDGQYLTVTGGEFAPA